jgi:glycosyltransferase involved in cell wall biosynthesis
MAAQGSGVLRFAAVRVLVADTYYPAFLAAHYASRPELAQAGYREQLRSLLGTRFGTSDAYSRELRALGHEAADVIVNSPELQAAWAREHGVRGQEPLRRLAAAVPTRAGALARTALLHRVALAQILSARPDVLYLQDLWFFSRRELDAIRRAGILVAGQIASEPPPPERLRGFDLLLTSFPHYVERFRGLGVDSEYFAIAFDQTIADAVDVAPDRDRAHGAVFVGGVNPRVHPAGTALLERLCERVNLQVWGYGRDELPAESPLRARHRGEAWGIEMYRVLADSKVVVNRHIEAAEGNANNMRLFEATGAGAALVTEAAPNLGELFEPGREVVTYADEEGLVARIERLLGDDAERTAIATAGQRRTMSDHTYADRIRQLAAILESRLA